MTSTVATLRYLFEYSSRTIYKDYPLVSGSKVTFEVPSGPQFSSQDVDNFPSVDNLHANPSDSVCPRVCVLNAFQDEYAHSVQIGVFT